MVRRKHRKNPTPTYDNEKLAELGIEAPKIKSIRVQEPIHYFSPVTEIFGNNEIVVGRKIIDAETGKEMFDEQPLGHWDQYSEKRGFLRSRFLSGCALAGVLAYNLLPTGAGVSFLQTSPTPGTSISNPAPSVPETPEMKLHEIQNYQPQREHILTNR